MIEVYIIVVAVAFDALRDRYYPDVIAYPAWSREQWRWHIFKWLGFYPPLIYVVAKWPIEYIAVAALGCLLLWRFVYTFRSRSRSSSRETAVVSLDQPRDLEF